MANKTDKEILDFTTHNIVLFPVELDIVKNVVKERGFSPRSGFSTAIRSIILEWAELQSIKRHITTGKF